ncbi:MAG: hypothetical protein HUU43_05185 [Ignavibacteriaceae bacterium]|nr:hypothetical protein [Ignavibacteriaceae bacterium]NUM70219.1 hypothetical protein [Ignavibacteriaceae bacterium]
MQENKRFYYKIYDDEGVKSYFKCNLPNDEVKKLIKEFEKDHQEYYNNDFLKFLKEHDPATEEIDVCAIYY